MDGATIGDGGKPVAVQVRSRSLPSSPLFCWPDPAHSRDAGCHFVLAQSSCPWHEICDQMSSDAHEWLARWSIGQPQPAGRAPRGGAPPPRARGALPRKGRHLRRRRAPPRRGGGRGQKPWEPWLCRPAHGRAARRRDQQRRQRGAWPRGGQRRGLSGDACAAGCAHVGWAAVNCGQHVNDRLQALSCATLPDSGRSWP